jgi:hypothetical protein
VSTNIIHIRVHARKPRITLKQVEALLAVLSAKISAEREHQRELLRAGLDPDMPEPPIGDFIL